MKVRWNRARQALAQLFSRVKVDLWDVILLAGAGLFGGGVWLNWGPGWACMSWGALLLAVGTMHAVRLGRDG